MFNILMNLLHTFLHFSSKWFYFISYVSVAYILSGYARGMSFVILFTDYDSFHDSIIIH